ncbi:MAG: hypothetical protein V2B20_06435 [Pseudomonadota bacterium]
MKEISTISHQYLIDLIQHFITASPLNTMQDKSGEPAWDTALVGFSSGADPIWQQYKEDIGAFHWTPWEIFNQHRSEENVSADQLTVVSWILPQRKMVRMANRQAQKFPAEEWARIRVYVQPGSCNFLLEFPEQNF